MMWLLCSSYIKDLTFLSILIKVVIKSKSDTWIIIYFKNESYKNTLHSPLVTLKFTSSVSWKLSDVKCSSPAVLALQAVGAGGGPGRSRTGPACWATGRPRRGLAGWASSMERLIPARTKSLPVVLLDQQQQKKNSERVRQKVLYPTTLLQQYLKVLNAIIIIIMLFIQNL